MRVTVALFSVFAAALAAGCSSPAFNVGVSLSPDLKETYSYYPSIEVDLAGLTPSEVERVKGYGVDQWFEAGNPMRRSFPRKTLRFSENHPLDQEVGKKDPVWEEWEDRGVEVMAVFVNLPAGEASSGSADPRKHLVRIKSEHWYQGEGGSLWIEVGAAGIVELAERPRRPVDPPARKPVPHEDGYGEQGE